jgi:hypothetical protein
MQRIKTRQKGRQIRGSNWSKKFISVLPTLKRPKVGKILEGERNCFNYEKMHGLYHMVIRARR